MTSIIPGDYDSWTVLDSITAIKHMDKSSFVHHGSGLPKGMADYFLEEPIAPGKRFNISLFCNGVEYEAQITRDTALGRYRIFWRADLKGFINEIFDYDEISEIKEFPDMTFIRIGPKKYSIMFSGMMSSELISDSEYEMELDREIFEKIIYRKTEDELESILGEMFIEGAIPVERRVTVAKRVVRNPQISDNVKRRAGYRCEVCGTEGFLKPNGGRYAEAHHLFELSKMRDEVRFEHPDYMICVCPTCHRVIHYGDDSELKIRLKSNTDSSD